MYYTYIIESSQLKKRYLSSLSIPNNEDAKAKRANINYRRLNNLSQITQPIMKNKISMQVVLALSSIFFPLFIIFPIFT